MFNNTQESNCVVIKYSPHLLHLKWSCLPPLGHKVSSGEDTSLRIWWASPWSVPLSRLRETITQPNHSPILLDPRFCSLPRAKGSRRTALGKLLSISDRSETQTAATEQLIFQMRTQLPNMCSMSKALVSSARAAIICKLYIIYIYIYEWNLYVFHS